MVLPGHAAVMPALTERSVLMFAPRFQHVPTWRKHRDCHRTKPSMFPARARESAAMPVLQGKQHKPQNDPKETKTVDCK